LSSACSVRAGVVPDAAAIFRPCSIAERYDPSAARRWNTHTVPRNDECVRVIAAVVVPPRPRYTGVTAAVWACVAPGFSNRLCLVHVAPAPATALAPIEPSELDPATTMIRSFVCGVFVRVATVVGDAGALRSTLNCSTMLTATTAALPSGPWGGLGYTAR
jgi:hypothetical protein